MQTGLGDDALKRLQLWDFKLVSFQNQEDVLKSNHKVLLWKDFKNLAVEGQYQIPGVCVSQLIKKHAEKYKKVHLKYTFLKITCASQKLIDQSTCKNYGKCAKPCKTVQNRASQIFWKPIQKRASSRSVQLEVVLLIKLRPYCILK